ncbi:hypothetical protein ACQKP0_01315 [Heyndrickxia sp. NPDC080065]|uniref:hypothetical protein n=1 Tax=Heyndrickxia sp. NPDC080065 TaxID=3390568 RepID=UPI003D08AE92
MIRKIVIGSALAFATAALLPVVKKTLRPLAETGIKGAKSTYETIKEEVEDIIAEAKLERMQDKFDKELANDEEIKQEMERKNLAFTLIPAAKDKIRPLVDTGIKSVKSTIETIKEEVEDLIVEAKLERKQKLVDKEISDIEEEIMDDKEAPSIQEITNEEKVVNVLVATHAEQEEENNNDPKNG